MSPGIDKRLVEIGDGLFAYLMTPGTWGFSNSGLIVDGEHSLLVDTLFDTAHTLGDVLVHLPGSRTVFTGDILFADAHPLVWEGPVANWIVACRTVLDLDPVTVVPGHGPLTDISSIQRELEYLEFISSEARQRYDAGLSVEEAARDISISAFDGWLDAERIYINVHTLYRDFRSDRKKPDPVEMFAGMARLRRDWKLS